MTRILTSSLVLAWAALCPLAACADIYGDPNGVTMTFTYPPGGPHVPPVNQTISFTSLPNAPFIGDATVIISVDGNYANNSEYFSLIMGTDQPGSQISFGTGLNGNTGDDIFNFTDFGADIGVDGAPITSAPIIIPAAQFAPMLSDQQIDFTFSFSNGGLIGNTVYPNEGDTLSVTLKYGYQLLSPASVPEPSAILLGGMAALLLGVVAYRRRRKSAA